MFTSDKWHELSFLSKTIRRDQIHKRVKYEVIKLILECLLDKIRIW